MKVLVKAKHQNGTKEKFITEKTFDQVCAELTARNGEISSLVWSPITYGKVKV